MFWFRSSVLYSLIAGYLVVGQFTTFDDDLPTNYTLTGDRDPPHDVIRFLNKLNMKVERQQQILYRLLQSQRQINEKLYQQEQDRVYLNKTDVDVQEDNVTNKLGQKLEQLSDNVLRPSLTRIIQGDNRPIYALTSFNNQLFVIRFPSNGQIEVYDTTTFELTRNITISEAGSALFDMTPCSTDNNCLYVSDYDNRKVHRVILPPTPDNDTLSTTARTATTTTTTSWRVSGKPHALSVNGQRNVLLTVRLGTSPRTYVIDEYTPNGSRVRRINSANYPWHAVEHVNGTMAVSVRGPLVFGVCLMSVDDGHVVRSYGETTSGSERGQMNGPRSLVVDRDGYVMAVDADNNRILVLTPSLSEASPLPLAITANEPINRPRDLWLDETRGRLYVGESGSPYRILVFDNVVNFGTIFTRNELL